MKAITIKQSTSALADWVMYEGAQAHCSEAGSYDTTPVLWSEETGRTALPVPLIQSYGDRRRDEKSHGDIETVRIRLNAAEVGDEVWLYEIENCRDVVRCVYRKEAKNMWAFIPRSEWDTE